MSFQNHHNILLVEEELSPSQLVLLNMEKEKEESEKQEEDKKSVLEYKCKIKNHHKQDISYVCTKEGCEAYLICKKCLKKHEKEHGEFIQQIDLWFNRMFSRNVEDRDNNKVSRKCGMNLGRLSEDLREYKEVVEGHKKQWDKQLQHILDQLMNQINERKREYFQCIDKQFELKNQQLQEQNIIYKKLKSLNRFTILENLKRQHNPNGQSPPTIPINSIVKFLIASEKQFLDKQEIEGQHKALSKLLRDTERLFEQLTNEQKQLKASMQKFQKSESAEQTQLFQDFEAFLFSQSSSKKSQTGNNNDNLIQFKDDHQESKEVDNSSYECVSQENFNNAQFIDFERKTVRVFADSSIQLYDINEETVFDKKESCRSTLQIVTTEQQMYEIGAITEVQNFFIPSDSQTHSPLSPIYSNDSIQQNPKSLPLLILGLKNDPARIEVCDMNSKKKVCDYENAHECSITCIELLQINPQHSVLFAAASYDGVIKTWLLQVSESKIFTLQPQFVLRAHADFVTTMILFPRQQNKVPFLISGGSDKKIILWDWNFLSEQNQSSPSSKNVNHTFSSKENVEVVNYQEISEDVKKSSINGIKKAPFFKQFKIQIQKSHASPIKQNQDKSPVLIKNPLKIMDNVHTDKINCFEILDEGYLASGSSDGSIKIWDMDTQKEHKMLQNKYIVNSICRLKRGNLVCSANNVKMSIYLLNIWNWELGQVVQEIKGHAGRISKIHVIQYEEYESPALNRFKKQNGKLSNYNHNFNSDSQMKIGQGSSQVYNSNRLQKSQQRATNGQIKNNLNPTIVSCERNKVIRIWKSNCQPNLHHPIDLSFSSPNSVFTPRILSSSRQNRAVEFFHNYHIELDPSLTPKCKQPGRSVQYEKTPVSNHLNQINHNFSHYVAQQMSPSLDNGKYFSPPSSMRSRLIQKISQGYEHSEQVDNQQHHLTQYSTNPLQRYCQNSTLTPLDEVFNESGQSSPIDLVKYQNQEFFGEMNNIQVSKFSSSEEQNLSNIRNHPFFKKSFSGSENNLVSLPNKISHCSSTPSSFSDIQLIEDSSHQQEKQQQQQQQEKVIFQQQKSQLQKQIQQCEPQIPLQQISQSLPKQYDENLMIASFSAPTSPTVDDQGIKKSKLALLKSKKASRNIFMN